MKHTAYPGTQAVLRAVSLLKAFTPGRPEIGLAELSRTVGLNKTTAYRLLSALESEGMVERAPGAPAYRLGRELLALGSLALGSGDLRELSRSELHALALQTRETATLEVLVGSDVVILGEVAGSHVIGTMPSVGSRWPAHATSTGKVLLAHLPDLLLEGSLVALTPRTITDHNALRRELARVRERGYATSYEELEPGFVAVAAPVRGGGGEVVAAISVGGPKSRLTLEKAAEIGRQLPRAAARVSERLGYREQMSDETTIKKGAHS
jgi:IclR family transcriptional regulator, acetate operon repressor